MRLSSGGQVGSRMRGEVSWHARSHAAHLTEDPDVRHPTFAPVDLTEFCGPDELGLRAVGQHLARDRTGWFGCTATGAATVARPAAKSPKSSSARAVPSSVAERE